MFCLYGQKQLHVKRLEEYETNTDQLTNFGFGGVSSTCPTTKVPLPPCSPRPIHQHGIGLHYIKKDLKMYKLRFVKILSKQLTFTVMLYNIMANVSFTRAEHGNVLTRSRGDFSESPMQICTYRPMFLS